MAGQVAIVTGASRGIGLAIARRIVADGGRVVITARKEETLREAAATLGGDEFVLAVAGKADDVAHQDQTVAAAMDRFGRIDMLVNNTGINPVYGPLIDIDLTAARKIVEVNCLAAISWATRVFRACMHEHGGAIVNMSSVAGMRPAPGIGFYGASKAMLSHITAELALELAPQVRVNAVAPAVVRTDFATALFEGREDEVIATYPLKRLGVPDDVAGVVSFLLSEDSAWVTGQTIVVDGGLTLNGGV
jgi:3-oxoacyl-[acyl-carrier protein] reductase